MKSIEALFDVDSVRTGQKHVRLSYGIAAKHVQYQLLGVVSAFKSAATSPGRCFYLIVTTGSNLDAVSVTLMLVVIVTLFAHAFHYSGHTN